MTTHISETLPSTAPGLQPPAARSFGLPALCLPAAAAALPPPPLLVLPMSLPLLVGITLLLVVVEQHLTAEDLERHLGTPRAWCASHAQKSSCEWAQRAGSAQDTVPSALHGSAEVLGCFADQPDAPACQSRRAHPARLAAQSVPNAVEKAPVAGSVDAAGWPAASRRSRGFAQSCGRCRSFDTGRSDLCSRHQQGSCGSSFVRLARDPAQSSSFFRKLSELSTSPNGGQRPEAAIHAALVPVQYVSF